MGWKIQKILLTFFVVFLLASPLAALANPNAPYSSSNPDGYGVWDVSHWFDYSNPAPATPATPAPSPNVPAADVGTGSPACKNVVFGICLDTLPSNVANSAPVQTVNDILKNDVRTLAACNPFTGTVGRCLAVVADGGIVIALKIANALLYLCSILFTFVVREMVVNMGHYVTSSSAIGIQAAWGIMRDIANIGIIGGLIATAIGTILQTGYNANKFLARLIIAALLVNFSYFFAGAVIDSSNYLATAIYNATICQKNTDCTNTSISDRFEQLMPTHSWSDILGQTGSNLTGLVQSTQPTNQIADNDTQSLISDFMLLVIVLITIFVFLSAVGLLLGRFVSLIFILITSPVGIAASAIPGFEKYAKEWWSILFSQAFFAPVYFLLVGFSLMIIDSFQSAFASTTSSSLGQIITYLVAAVFMLLALRTAKQMSEAGKQYLGEFYKGAEKLTGWMPALYKYGLQTVGTQTVGRAGDRFSRGYEKWISTAPEKSLRKLIAGTALDRNLQKGLEAVGNAKFGGKEGFVDSLHAKETRNTRLSEVQKFQEALKKQPGLESKKRKAQEKHDAFLDEYGEVNAKGEKGKRAKIEDKLAMAKFKKNFSDLSDKEKQEIMDGEEWRAQYKNLDDLARKATGGKKGWKEMTNEERAKLTSDLRKSGKWKGRLWKEDKEKGTYGWESGFSYVDDLRRKIDLRSVEERDADALQQFQKKYDDLSDEEKFKVNQKKQILQDTIDDLRTPMNDVSWDIIKEEHLRNHGLLHDLTPMLSSKQYLEAMSDKSISKAEKNEMREARLGTLIKEAQEFERNVAELSDWEKPGFDRTGKVLRGSAEYDAYRGILHERLKKYVPPAEIVDFVESDSGVQTKIRGNRIFNDAITHGVYSKLQESSKISSGEKRRMRNLKRGRYADAIAQDEESEKIFDSIEKEEGIKIPEEKRDVLANDDFAKARYDKNFAELDEAQKKDIQRNALSAEEYEKIAAQKADGREKQLLRAAWLRKRAETAAERYFGGKSPTEIAKEVKQEDFGSRVGGKYMRREQLLASASEKDQIWQDKQAHAMAVHGSAEEVRWLKYSSSGENYRVDWKQVDEDRKAAGLDPVEVVLKKRESGNNAGGAEETPEEDAGNEVGRIVEHNAAAAGQRVAPVANVQQVETRIRQVLSEAPQGAQGIEDVLPQGPDAEIDAIVDDVAPAQLVYLPSDILENNRFAASLETSQIKTLLESSLLSPRIKRVLKQNIQRLNKKSGVVEWLETDEGKNLMK